MPQATDAQVDTIADHAQRLFIEASHLDDAHEYRKAFMLFLEAAELGDSGAQINLGNYYAAGRGTRRNLAEAERWYKKAYRAGSGAAANNLAVDKKNSGNLRAAILWFKKAIALNDGDSAVELAKLYMNRKQVKLAIAALKHALTMTRSDLTEYGREEAEALLKQLT